MACSRCWARVSFSSSPWSWACCALRSVICVGQARLAGQRLAGEVLAAHRRSPSAAWSVQLGRLLLELVDLQLHALAAGGDVGDAAAYLREQVQLALVAVVERLARVLGAVEGLVGLRPEDQADALHETHGVRPLFVAHAVRRLCRFTLGAAQGGPRAAPVGSVATSSRVVSSRPSTKAPRCSVAASPRAHRRQTRPSSPAARAVPRRRGARPRPPRRRAPRPRAPARRLARRAAAARTESSQTVRARRMKAGDERYYRPATRARCAASSATSSTAGSRSSS